MMKTAFHGLALMSHLRVDAEHMAGSVEQYLVAMGTLSKHG